MVAYNVLNALRHQLLSRKMEHMYCDNFFKKSKESLCLFHNCYKNKKQLVENVNITYKQLIKNELNVSLAKGFLVHEVGSGRRGSIITNNSKILKKLAKIGLFFHKID